MDTYGFLGIIRAGSVMKNLRYELVTERIKNIAARAKSTKRTLL